MPHSAVHSAVREDLFEEELLFKQSVFRVASSFWTDLGIHSDSVIFRYVIKIPRRISRQPLPTHSQRRAVIGSIALARRAGTRPENNTMSPSNAMAATPVQTSVGVTPNN